MKCKHDDDWRFKVAHKEAWIAYIFGGFSFSMVVWIRIWVGKKSGRGIFICIWISCMVLL